MPHLREVTYRFEDTGIRLSTSVTSATIAWAGITEATETDGLFLLFIGRRLAYYIPHRVAVHGRMISASTCGRIWVSGRSDCARRMLDQSPNDALQQPSGFAVARFARNSLIRSQLNAGVRRRTHASQTFG
ncbi:MAG TPA: YcxB family protein [Gemmatimonadaceae bacterium]|nr:YcxB family protein [Gemmatimonadaceae bacterium]